MGQRIDLFKTSTLGDKNQGIESPKRMGKKEDWIIKPSNLNYRKKRDEFEMQENIIIDEKIGGFEE